MNFFKTLNLRRKLVLLFLIVAIVPMLLFNIIAYIIYSNNLRDVTTILGEQSLQRYEKIVSERMQNINQIVFSLVADQDVISLAQLIDDSSVAESSLAIPKAELLQIFKKQLSSNSDISGIVYMNANGQYCAYSRKMMISDSIWADNEQRREYLNEIEETKGLSYYSTENMLRIDATSVYAASVGHSVMTLVDKDDLGGLLVFFDPNLLLSNDMKDEVPYVEGITTQIIDQNGKILAHTDRSLIGTDYVDILPDDNVEVLMKPVDGTPWQVISVIDKSVLFQGIYSFRNVMWMLIIVTILLSSGILFVVTYQYMKTVTNIASEIKSYRGGKKGVRFDVDSKDELCLIAHQFHKMIERNDRLIKTLIQKNEEIAESAQRQKKAEIKALEAQINPHFIYNALDSINWLAIENDQIEISNMLSSLGSILRYSIANIDVVVPLEAELKWLEKYCFLQRERFNFSFDYEIIAPPETMGFPVYKMLLQPLIENVIMHGFETIKSGGLLRVIAQRTSENQLKLIIQDNGSGIDPKRLAELRADIANHVPLKSDSIGISNVINRLYLYYHDDAVLEIDSEMGKGTTITLLLPYDAKGEQF
jgi:two-component system sensor histidine kinase YesM